jgi:hypothetical protein
MKKLFTLLLVLIACSVSAIDMGPYDPGAARKSDLGTISTKADTDYVATSALALRLDTTNASISNNLDVAGDVGAATVNGVAPLTQVERDNSQFAKRWGIRIAKATADPDARVEYLYDAVGMTPAYMDYGANTFNYGSWAAFAAGICRPAMVNPDGSVKYYLDPNDQTKKLDGSASEISDMTQTANAMAEFKRLWLRQYEDANYEYWIYSNVQWDFNYHCDAFVNAAGVPQTEFYSAMYEGIASGTVLRSLATGTVMVSQMGSTEIDYADNNGSGWYINTWSQRSFIIGLHYLISKSTNGQIKFGQGNSAGADYIAPGALKATGQFWGDDATDAAVKTFYIENFWGNYWKRCAGLLYAQADLKIYTRNTPQYNDTGSDYLSSGKSLSGTSGTYLTAMALANNALIPVAGGGAETQYYCDGLWYATPGAGLFHYALVGGQRLNEGLCGPATAYLADLLSGFSPNIGAALSFLKP